MDKYEYNISSENSPEKFKIICSKIEETYPELQKNVLLIDVDGTTIQVYYINDLKVTVYDDYEVGAVYVLSDLDLKGINFKRCWICG